MSRTNPRSPDPNTLANVLDFAITRTVLKYELSFDSKALAGVVQHSLQCTTGVENDGAVTEELWLDSSYVTIEEVSVDGEVYSQLGKVSGSKIVGERVEREETGENEQKAAVVGTKYEIQDPTAEKGWKLEDRVQPYGSKLRIIFGKKYEQGGQVDIQVCAPQRR